MEMEKQIKLKQGAKISLLVLLLSIVGQIISIYQTSYQLVSPLIPENLIWEISKQFIFTAFVLTIASVLGLILYFYEKYLLIIILTVVVLLASRLIYLPLK